MRKLGNIGEEAAVKLLKKQGYKIIDRNYTVRGGEIDIIAKDKDTLVFVEVKLRKNDSFGRPSEFVDIYKQKKLIYAAECYINSNKLNNPSCRFDIVEIIGSINDREALKISEFNIIKNAFQC
ncbi:MAG: YraN family protein [Bacillota bacterium]|nr:YraN family protein [Bacillota bacterium]